MRTQPQSLTAYQQSVVVVPPLARDRELRLAREENRRLIRHIEAGGASILMYGGNANFYNLPLSEYAATLDFLAETVASDTWVMPAIGPDYGRMVDQVAAARSRRFPTVMMLPTLQMMTQDGAARAIRIASERFGGPIVLYLRAEGYLGLDHIAKLHAEGHIFSIKYAIQRADPMQDPFLRELVDIADPERVVSGIGERPAIAHFTGFGLKGFTTGSGAVAPRLSMELLRALQAGDRAGAERIRQFFLPLEDMRDAHNPARVLHDAVTLSGVAEMGPVLPLLSNLEGNVRDRVAAAAKLLGAHEQAAMADA